MRFCFAFCIIALLAPLAQASTPAFPCFPSQNGAGRYSLLLVANQPPARLAEDVVIDSIGCQRSFLYRGKTYPLDSFYRQDGERLRPFIERVPAALRELEEYQANRRSVRNAAYWGSAGLLIALAGFLVSDQIESKPDQILVRNIAIGSGILMAGTAVGYSFWVIFDNEKHLRRAVQKFNHVKPDDRIELRLGASIIF